MKPKPCRALVESEEQYQRNRTAVTVDTEYPERTRALAVAFPAIWQDPNTLQERKRMLALLVEEMRPFPSLTQQETGAIRTARSILASASLLRFIPQIRYSVAGRPLSTRSASMRNLGVPKKVDFRRRVMWAGTVLVTLVTLLLPGCVSTPRVKMSVDSLSRQTTDVGRSYILLPGNKDTADTDLQFQEFAGYVHKALVLRGFRHAQGGEAATTVIFLAYGVGDPQTHQYSYSLPVFGQTGVSGSTTTGSLYGSSFSSTTTYTPTYGVTSYTTQVGTITLYGRFIRLQAYDLDVYNRTKKLEEVWRSNIVSVGKLGDLRRVFPVMIAGSAKYLATNTGQRVEIVLDEQDAMVQTIKGGGR